MRWVNSYCFKMNKYVKTFPNAISKSVNIEKYNFIKNSLNSSTIF